MDNAFGQADAMVSVCSAVFGIIAIPLLAYFAFFRKKKKKE